MAHHGSSISQLQLDPFGGKSSLIGIGEELMTHDDLKIQVD